MSRRWLVVCVALAACANNVKQNKATGPDGVAKGAKPVELEEQERSDPKEAATYRGEVEGIVTYPGGDRIDWKLIELPPKMTGQLDLKLTWTTPRPDLRLAFDVFPAKAKPVAIESKRAGRAREAKVEVAAGKYYVRIYAQQRGDAGTYKLVATFTPVAAKQAPGPIDLPLPPPLPAIVIPKCQKFDQSNPDCEKVCDKSAPSGWKGCPPCHKFSATNPDCATMCPAAAPSGWSGCAPCHVFSATNPQCATMCPAGAPATWAGCASSRPIVAEIKGTSVEDDTVVVLLKLGANHPVTASWSAELLAGKQGDNLLPNGRGKIESANGPSVKVRFKVTKSVTDNNPRVRLSPPP